MPSSVDGGSESSESEFAGFPGENNEVEMTTEEKELKKVFRQREQVWQRVVNFWNTLAEGDLSLP